MIFFCVLYSYTYIRYTHPICCENAVVVRTVMRDEAGGKEAAADDGDGDAPTAAACNPPIEVVHAFGTCPSNVRENICVLDDARVAYTIGSRVAITDGTSGGTDSSGDHCLTFLSTGLRVSRVTALACSPDKRFVVVCYKAVDEPLTAYATVYHMPTRPRPSRVKTLSYVRPNKQHHQAPLASDSPVGGVEAVACCCGGGDSDSGRRLHPRGSPSANSAEFATAEFATADFSHDSRLLALLHKGPGWTLLWFEWKTGNKMFTLQLDSPVHSVAFSPLDDSKTATAGAAGHFRIWRTQGDKVTPMVPIVDLREVNSNATTTHATVPGGLTAVWHVSQYCR